MITTLNNFILSENINNVQKTIDGFDYIQGKKYWYVRTSSYKDKKISDFLLKIMPKFWTPFEAFSFTYGKTNNPDYKIFKNLRDADKFIKENKPDNVFYYDEKAVWE